MFFVDCWMVECNEAFDHDHNCICTLCNDGR